MIDGELYRRPAKLNAAVGPGIDLWLRGNAVFGVIVGAGFIAMAWLGSADSQAVQRAVEVPQVAVSDGAATRD